MNISYLADENIPLYTVKDLKRIGIKIESISNVQRGLNNTGITKYAYSHNLILLTFDKDFGELIVRKKIDPKVDLTYRFIPQSPKYITKNLKELLTQDDFDPTTKITIVQEHYVRPLIPISLQLRTF